MSRLSVPPGWVILATAFLVGCGGSSGPGRLPLSGTVKVNGEDIEKGAISFRPAYGHDGPAALATINKGRYGFSSSSGPVPGPHKVVIDVDTPPTNNTVVLPAGGPKAQLTDVPPSGSPQQPNASQTHFELEYTVPDDGTKTKDFEL